MLRGPTTVRASFASRTLMTGSLAMNDLCVKVEHHRTGEDGRTTIERH
jgi:hypothetical protein